MKQPLDLAELRRSLAGTQFAEHLHHFPSIGSTNTHAMQQASAGAASGSVYIAEEQTAGRGRGAHAWRSAAGEGLYVSMLVRPRLAAADSLWLSLATGLAARRAVIQLAGITADIRWPNDLMFGEKKLGGILTEIQTDADALRHAVIGVGINVNQREFPADLANEATSLRLATGAEQFRQALLVALLRSLAEELHLLETRQPCGQGLAARVSDASTWVRGKSVTITERDDGAVWSGTTCGLDDRGFLLVKAGCSVHKVISGSVRAAK